MSISDLEKKKDSTNDELAGGDIAIEDGSGLGWNLNKSEALGRMDMSFAADSYALFDGRPMPRQWGGSRRLSVTVGGKMMFGHGFFNRRAVPGFDYSLAE